MSRRTKDWDWEIQPKENARYSWDAVNAAILMDLRDELKKLNAVLECPNFLAIPTILREIKRNTTKPPTKRKVSASHGRELK